MRLSRKWWFGAVPTLILGTALLAGPADATLSTAKSTVLAQSVVKPTTIFSHGTTATGHGWLTLLATYGLTDGYVVDNKFDPGQSTGWHSHPGPSIVFVVAGTITNYTSDQPHCAGVSYGAGSSFVDQGGTDVHILVNNGTVAAETIAVQFIPSGQTRRIDEPEPAGCHL
jgi:uncharacterized cupin superfamily protein